MFEEWSASTRTRRSLDAALAGEIPEDFESMISTFEEGTKIASRNSSGKILQQVAKAIPYLAGGSADLAPSTKTYLDEKGSFKPMTSAAETSILEFESTQWLQYAMESVFMAEYGRTARHSWCL